MTPSSIVSFSWVQAACFVIAGVALSGGVVALLRPIKTATYPRQQRTFHDVFNSLLPLELRKGRWFLIWMSKLKAEHSLMRLSVTRATVGENIPTSLEPTWLRWLRFCTKILTLISLPTVVLYTLVEQGAACPDQSQPESCEARSYFHSSAPACIWRGGYCEANMINFSFSFFLAASSIFSLLSSILAAATSFLVTFWLVSSEGLHRKPPASPDCASMGDINADEFLICQTIPSTYMKGARLEKLRATLDQVDAVEEAASLTHHQLTLRSTLVKRVVFHRERENLRRIRQARRELESQRTLCDTWVPADRREEFLLKLFISSQQQTWADRLLVQAILCPWPFFAGHDLFAKPALRLLALVVLLATPLGLLALNVFLGQNLRTLQAFLLWVELCALSLLGDLLVIEPARIWLKFVYLPRTARPRAFALCGRLLLFARLVLSRRFGMMRQANDAVQHFNVACRLARRYPELPAARLLICLNDSDCALDDNSGSGVGDVRRWDMPAVLDSALTALVFGAPPVLAEALEAAIVVLATHGWAYGLCRLATVHVGAVLVGILTLILVPCSVEYLHRREERRAANEEERRKSAKAFTRKALVRRMRGVKTAHVESNVLPTAAQLAHPSAERRSLLVHEARALGMPTKIPEILQLFDRAAAEEAAASAAASAYDPYASISTLAGATSPSSRQRLYRAPSGDFSPPPDAFENAINTQQVQPQPFQSRLYQTIALERPPVQQQQPRGYGYHDALFESQSAPHIQNIPPIPTEYLELGYDEEMGRASLYDALDPEESHMSEESGPISVSPMRSVGSSKFLTTPRRGHSLEGIVSLDLSSRLLMRRWEDEQRFQREQAVAAQVLEAQEQAMSRRPHHSGRYRSKTLPQGPLLPQ